MCEQSRGTRKAPPVAPQIRPGAQEARSAGDGHPLSRRREAAAGWRPARGQRGAGNLGGRAGRLGGCPTGAGRTLAP